jgi:predicted ribosomally synthesized peptide with SipW-like signal peptide
MVVVKRRLWPDFVIVIAVLALGAGGVWALWGDRFQSKRTIKTAPATPAGTPMT